jgi:hypothetical protein
MLEMCVPENSDFHSLGENFVNSQNGPKIDIEFSKFTISFKFSPFGVFHLLWKKQI